MKKTNRIIELYQFTETARSTESVEKKIKDLFPESFLQIGKWYQNPKGWIFCYRGKFSDCKDVSGAFGWNSKGDWVANLAVIKGVVHRLLSNDEVKKLLLNESAKRGLLNNYHTVEFTNGRLIGYKGARQSPRMESEVIFYDGAWAKKSTQKDTNQIKVEFERVEPTCTGRWVINKKGNACVFYTETNKAYGFVFNGESWDWNDLSDCCHINCENCQMKPAEFGFVKQLLILEAIKRGFKSDVTFIDLSHGVKDPTLALSDVSLDAFWNPETDRGSHIFNMSLRPSSGVIYRFGVWAEIVPKIEKPLNNWYTDNHRVLYFKDAAEFYGFNKDGEWIEGSGCYHLEHNAKNWQLASDDLVKDLLKAEAEKRGFIVGKSFYGVEGANKNELVKITGALSFQNSAGLKITGLYHQSSWIMLNGIWSDRIIVLLEVKQWYKSKSSSLAFFLSESQAFGFTKQNVWFGVDLCKHSLNNGKWELADPIEVKMALMRYALTNYKFGQTVICAYQSEHSGQVGAVGFIPAPEFDLIADLLAEPRICLFNSVKGTWAKRQN